MQFLYLLLLNYRFNKLNVASIKNKLPTSHAEGSPQPGGLLLALLELHAAHPDDLTHQEEARPHQVAAAQVLGTKDKQR